MWEHDAGIWYENFADFSLGEQRDVVRAAQDAVRQARIGQMTEDIVRSSAHQLLSIAGMLGFTQASQWFRDIEQSVKIDSEQCAAFEETLVAFEIALERFLARVDAPGSTSRP
jgi:HPt (histidine-containing phosphotransfer) domain-containing protein